MSGNYWKCMEGKKSITGNVWTSETAVFYYESWLDRVTKTYKTYTSWRHKKNEDTDYMAFVFNLACIKMSANDIFCRPIANFIFICNIIY